MFRNIGHSKNNYRAVLLVNIILNILIVVLRYVYHFLENYIFFLHLLYYLRLEIFYQLSIVMKEKGFEL